MATSLLTRVVATGTAAAALMWGGGNLHNGAPSEIPIAGLVPVVPTVGGTTGTGLPASDLDVGGRNGSVQFYPARIRLRLTQDQSKETTFAIAFWQPSKASTTDRSDGRIELTFYGLRLISTDRQPPIEADRFHLIHNSLTVVPGESPQLWLGKINWNNVPSGRYSGYLLARRGADGQTKAGVLLTIPVLIELRDAPTMPLAILIVGVFVSLGLLYYQKLRLDRDMNLMRAADAEALILSDPALTRPGGPAEPFRTKLVDQLRSAVEQMDDRWPNQGGVSLGKLNELQATWIKWQSERRTWLKWLILEQNAIEQMKAIGTTVASGHVVRTLEKGHENALASETAEAFGTLVQSRLVRVNTYLDLRVKIVRLASDLASVPDGTTKQGLLEKQKALLKKWDGVDPSDSATFARATKAVDDEFAALETQIKAAFGATSHPPPVVAQAVAEAAANAAEAGRELIPRRFEARLRHARQARLAYASITGIVIFAGLVTLGFQQTYLASPIFGADRYADYARLIFWALGADLATRTTIMAFGGGLFGTGADLPARFGGIPAPFIPPPIGTTGNPGTAGVVGGATDTPIRALSDDSDVDTGDSTAPEMRTNRPVVRPMRLPRL